MKTYQRMRPHTPDCERGEDWRDQAACRDTDPELFFVPGRSDAPASRRQVAQTKAVCAGCTARAACLNYALDSGQEYGIFGGTSAEERRRISRHLPTPQPELSRLDREQHASDDLAAGQPIRVVAAGWGLSQDRVQQLYRQVKARGVAS